MSLILVVEPDARHAAQLPSIGRSHVHAELVMAESGDRAGAALDHRVPDIVLTAPLLPPHDEAILADSLPPPGGAGARHPRPAADVSAPVEAGCGAARHPRPLRERAHRAGAAGWMRPGAVRRAG